jgi:hypothetical protein
MNVEPYRYYPPTLPRQIDCAHEGAILMLWNMKRDTYAISLQLGIPEHQVANVLARIRDAEVAPHV